MSFTNSTPNYGLPQWIGTDKPTYLGDQNTAYSTIDTQLKANADAAAAATSTANTAASTATTASTNATAALNTANSAASEAAAATSAAASATSTANTAATNASAALRASAANTIENLAPAYDPTLTYSVGNLVTYIDENNSGKLYKCIVAVTTPEAFNINKWDDVTTSEVYAAMKKELASVTYDGVMTAKEGLDYLGTMLQNISLGRDLILYNIAANGSVTVQKVENVTGNEVTFSSVNGGGLRRAYIITTTIGFNNNSSRGYTEFDTQTGTMTATNNSSSVPSAGDKYIIVKA